MQQPAKQPFKNTCAVKQSIAVAKKNRQFSL